ncbi:NDP-hexose 2,3-dehydratase family protein [Streptomyces sp. NPDC058231]|uniref:NDP-hexose 2,3-dehydratase family protein n=1 Tax=Streptomyces sp. NPDC058231 TaxID=3346392 RepID=UPI0036E7BF9E
MSPVPMAANTSAVLDGGFAEWWARRCRAHRFTVRRVPFAELDDWRFDAGTGDLGHRSGRFFTVCGARAGADAQPVLHQPEIGVLGLLAKRIDGVTHCLLQAKMEPGNVNTVQLSPTVQATRSNYTRVHRGAPVRYLEYFADPGRGRVLVDTLQSEHGTWFHRKRNRNVIVETDEDVPVHDDFRWVPLSEVGALLTVPNLVNMDTRTVLACLLGRHAPEADLTLLSWFTGVKARHDRTTALVGLDTVPGWLRTPTELRSRDGTGFTVLAVSVTAPNREATAWTQPLLAPGAPGVVAFLARTTSAGRTQLLVRARPEIGCRDVAELGPTVQTGTGHDEPLLEPALALAAEPGRVWYDTVLSEEGGRLWHAENRYLVVDAGDTVPSDVGADFHWTDLAALTGLLRHSYYLNVQARSLLAGLALASGRRS